MLQGTDSPLGRSIGSMGFPDRPAMASVWPKGRDATCGAGSSFGDASAMEVGEQRALPELDHSRGNALPPRTER